MEIILLDPSVAHGLMRTLLICFVLWLLMIVAIMLDLWDGLYTARKTGEKIRSRVLRITISKISEYWRFMLIAFLLDCVGVLFPFFALPYVSILFFLGLVGVEIKSMVEHAKRRKSRVSDAQDIIRRIIECSTNGKAQDIINAIASTQSKPKFDVDEDGTV